MNRKKGFTVVELVIVIAVIGILSAILIPTFAGLINKANAQQKQLDIRNAYVAYASDEDTDGENLYAENEVYIIDVATVVAGETEVYTYNNGTWTLDEAPEGYNYVSVKLDGSTPVAFNGYYIFYAVAIVAAP